MIKEVSETFWISSESIGKKNDYQISWNNEAHSIAYGFLQHDRMENQAANWKTGGLTLNLYFASPLKFRYATFYHRSLSALPFRKIVKAQISSRLSFLFRSLNCCELCSNRGLEIPK